MALQIQKQALWLIAGYAVTVLGAGGGGYFCYDSYRKARDEEASLHKQIQMADIKIERIPSLETDVICLRENVSELVKILPNDKEVNDFVNKLNDFAQESNVRISSLLDEKDRTRKKGSTGRDAFDKVVYRVKMTANLPQLLAFLSQCEGWERFVRVTSLEVKAGDWKEEMAREEVVHEVSVALETYAYRGNDGNASITIPNYDKRRDQLSDEIVSRRADIRVEHYDFVANALRRDPFVDPRIRVADQVDGVLAYAEQKALVDHMVERALELVNLAQAALDPDTNFIRRLEIENAIDAKLGSLRKDLDGAIAEHWISDVSLKRRVEREVMPVLKDLTGRNTAATAAATLKDLKQFSAEMTDLLDREDYEGVLAKHEIINGRVDMNVLSPEAAAVLQRIDYIAQAAEAAVEFAKKDIRITGAVVQETDSVVVVNGKVLKEGDSFGDLVIHRIKSDSVEFRYRGVILNRLR